MRIVHQNEGLKEDGLIMLLITILAAILIVYGGIVILFMSKVDTDRELGDCQREQNGGTT